MLLVNAICILFFTLPTSTVARRSTDFEPRNVTNPFVYKPRNIPPAALRERDSEYVEAAAKSREKAIRALRNRFSGRKRGSRCETPAYVPDVAPSDSGGNREQCQSEDGRWSDCPPGFAPRGEGGGSVCVYQNEDTGEYYEGPCVDDYQPPTAGQGYDCNRCCDAPPAPEAPSGTANVPPTATATVK